MTVASAAASGSVSVIAMEGPNNDGAGCVWRADSAVDWITLEVDWQHPPGNGTVVYSVAANTGTSARTGTVSIADHTFTVTQAAP